MLVTHDLEEALAIGDRVVFLSKRPATIIREERVGTPRPRSVDSPIVSSLYATLMQHYPGLLSGDNRYAAGTGKS